jgi:RimJ/RimL family protein N-acetyltransferase
VSPPENALSVEQHEPTIRPITGLDELDLFCRMPYFRNEELADDLDSGHRRPDWLWIALQKDRLLARAAWWGRRRGGPAILDVFDIEDGDDGGRVDIGARLLVTAMSSIIPSGGGVPEYSRFVPSDWRDHPASRRVVEDRMAAAGQAGARLLVERLRLEWRAGTPIPAPTGRLTFRRADDHDQLITLMTQVLDGTLDAHARVTLAGMSAEQAAVRQYKGELMQYESPQDWWRIAELPDGQPVGFVIPAQNGDSPIIAYIGVVPAHRGNGYAGEILVEGTRILADQGVPRIVADTDLGNVPMAGAFHQTGWVTFGHQIDMTWT